VAPDGSLFVSDWVLRDYNLHNRGAVWHIRAKEAKKPDRPEDPRKALFSAHRPLREAAARKLAADAAGRDFLRGHLASADDRVRATCITALIDVKEKLDLGAIADRDAQVGIRALAVRTLTARGADVSRFLEARQPAELRREAVAGLKDKARLLELLLDKDPFMQHAAGQQLARLPALLDAIDVRSLPAQQRIGLLLAHRASGRSEGEQQLPVFLADADEDVRFLAVKWVADRKLTRYRPAMVKALQDRKATVRMYLACATALARIDDRPVEEGKMAEYFVDRIKDEAAEPAARVIALQMIPATQQKLTVDLLAKLAAQPDRALQREALRALGEHPSAKRHDVLLEVLHNPKLDENVRAQALVGLADRAGDMTDELLKLARGESAALRDEALRALVGVKLSADQQTILGDLGKRQPAVLALVKRVLSQPFRDGRPPATDTAAWLERMAGPADAEVGRRIFANSKLGGCARCHRVEGRGQDIGPDLSSIGRTERRSILESILQPSANVAPHYQVWQIETADGKTRAGMLMKTVLDEYTYADAKGELFKINTRDVVQSRALPTSIMPDNLADQFTDQELRDLLAYLTARR
jgi:putative heme-binding domain-containing protein